MSFLKNSISAILIALASMQLAGQNDPQKAAVPSKQRPFLAGRIPLGAVRLFNAQRARGAAPVPQTTILVRAQVLRDLPLVTSNEAFFAEASYPS